MKNNLEDLSRELYKVTMELGDMENTEMEVIHHIANKLQPQLKTEEETQKALVNMFVLGQVFNNQNEDESTGQIETKYPPLPIDRGPWI